MKRKRTLEFTRHMRHIENVTDASQLIEPIRDHLQRIPYRILCEHTAPIAAKAFYHFTADRFKLIIQSVARHLHVQPSDMKVEATRGTVEILKALSEHASGESSPPKCISTQLKETTQRHAPACASCRHIQNVINHTHWCFSDQDVDNAMSSADESYSIMNASRKVDFVACCITTDPYAGLFLFRLGLLPIQHEELLYEVSMPCAMDRHDIKRAALSYFQRRRREKS